MLLNSDYDAAAYDANLMGYSPVGTLLDDVSFQMAASNLARRTSRGSNPQRYGGGAMRVVKPSSANNSPRTTLPIARRRTMMNDMNARKRSGMADQAAMMAAGMASGFDGLSGMEQSSRPVSWHPSTQMPFQMAQSNDMYMQNNLHRFDVPPTPAVYSGCGTPASFSPESLTYNYFDQPQYPFGDSALMSANTFDPSAPLYFPQSTSASQQDYNDYFVQPKFENTGLYSSAEWDSFAMNGFHSTTAPPTPDNFLPIQHPEPSLQSDNAIPYHSLEDEDQDGEELVGMGLYDAPEKAAPSDPQLDNYRALMMSQYLGPSYVKQEPARKGLKLEETWNPPASDDEEDGESEEDDETLPQASTTTAVDATTNDETLVPQANLVPNVVHFNNTTWI